METNKSIFVRHGYLMDNNLCQLEIQISKAGDMARYQSTFYGALKEEPEVKRGRWQEIHYSRKEGRPFINRDGRRLYIDRFLVG